MTIDVYVEGCVQFSKDTRKWHNLVDAMNYTVNDHGWYESSDNCEGGVDCSWAFQMRAAEIRQKAPQKFVEYLLNEVENDLVWEDDEEERNRLYSCIYDDYT